MSLVRWVGILRSKSSTVSDRLTAIEGLASLGSLGAGGVGALIETLESPQPALRTATYRALRTLELRGVRALVALELTLKHARPGVALPGTAYALEHLEAEFRRSA